MFVKVMAIGALAGAMFVTPASTDPTDKFSSDQGVGVFMEYKQEGCNDAGNAWVIIPNTCYKFATPYGRVLNAGLPYKQYRSSNVGDCSTWTGLLIPGDCNHVDGYASFHAVVE